jgi:uncharacterized protein (TIGR02145 family)
MAVVFAGADSINSLYKFLLLIFEQMKKIFFLMLTLFILSAASMNAQVLIGGDGTGNPDPSAVLELQSSDKGFLLPRVELTSTSIPAPLDAFIRGMTVYNTRIINDVTRGTYYCDGIRWVKVRNSMELVTKSDISGEVIKLIMDLAKNGGNVTNNCPATVTGNSGTTYPVGDFDVAGCWMIVNSKEGTPSATRYGEMAEGERGYYYTWEQAASACPEGYSLPTRAQYSWLGALVTHDASMFHLWRYGGTGSDSYAGCFHGEPFIPDLWGQGTYWTSTRRYFAWFADDYFVGAGDGPTEYFSVRCVKN